MNILKKVLLFLIVVIALLYVGSFFISGKVHVERSATINAASSVIFEQVNTLKNWENWSPWAESDPEATYIYSELASGEGASFSWDGEKSKQGTLSIVESIPSTHVKTALEFAGQGGGNGIWLLEETDNGTNVTWSFDSDMEGFIEKYMSLMMDNILGSMMETGLANIQKIAETMPVEPEVNNSPIQ